MFDVPPWTKFLSNSRSQVNNKGCISWPSSDSHPSSTSIFVNLSLAATLQNPFKNAAIAMHCVLGGNYVGY